MGTNYFALPDVCECCGRPERKIHIGKSGRMLRGYRADTWDNDPPIASWEEWKAYLRGDPKMQTENEYGVRETVEDLIAFFESSTLEARGKQYNYLVEHDYDMKNDILEPDGFSMHFGEFF